MKLSVQTSILAFAALGAAQFGDLPNCAKPCAANLPANCNLDVKCICSDQSWISGISCCIEKACTPPDQQKTLMVAQQLCDTVKVTLPMAASCPAGAGASGASSASSVGSSAASAGSSASSAAGATASSGASGAGATASSGASGSQSTASSMAGGATMASSATAAGASPTSSKTATSTGGAAQVLGSKMGAVGAAVAALALL